MKAKYYIKERHNPQLGTYYVACGKMSKTEAKSYERPMYGSNVMHGYDTEKLYKARIAELHQAGEKVQ